MNAIQIQKLSPSFFMTQIVHVANTNIEFEFASASLEPLAISWSRHPLCLQLQFLPLLYAQSEDIVAVTSLPGQDYFSVLKQTAWWSKELPRIFDLQEHEIFMDKDCQSWGASRQVKAWAEARSMHYAIPDWTIAQQVNGKAFSFRYTCLPEAELLNSESDLLHWLQKTKGPKILKNCFGLSGMGNRRIDDTTPSQELLAFCHKEWQLKRPIIAEPWLDRLHDFSTQWFIHSNQQIEQIGATRFETDHQGVYQGTLAGPEKILFAAFPSLLDEHRDYALKALKDIAKAGFFGFIGIDALLYRHPQNHSISLYPLVEINGRQTMSLVALRLQRRFCPDQVLRLAFKHSSSSHIPLLPSDLVNAKGKKIHFHRNLIAEIIKF